MKTKILAAAMAVASLGLCAEAGQEFTPCKSGVEKPSIKPTWSGAKVGTWTMDYETALAKASAEGKYTLLYFSGMWWCPRCKELEKYVLKQSAWKRFVKERGLYLAVIDNPARNGKGNWCWLWDDAYRKSARLSAEDAAAVIADRYGLQEELYDPAATRLRTAENYVVEVTKKGRIVETNYTVFAECPVSEYHSINYPGILVIAPDGSVAGRFIPDTSETPDYTLEGALDYCIEHVDAVINPAALDPWKGNWTVAFSEKDVSGVGTLALTISAKGQVKVTGFLPDGEKVSNTVPFVTGAETCSIPVRFCKRDDDPAFTLRIDNKTQAVTLESEDGEYALMGMSPAGLAAPAYVKCTVKGFPKEIGGCEVVAESVPESFVLVGKRTSYTSEEGYRFSYVQKTGVIKGSFSVLVLRNGRQAKVTVTVNGVCIGESAVGSAVAKGMTEAATVDMVPTEEPSDCDECGL